jgi:hypothetical protein
VLRGCDVAQLVGKIHALSGHEIGHKTGTGTYGHAGTSTLWSLPGLVDVPPSLGAAICMS